VTCPYDVACAHRQVVVMSSSKTDPGSPFGVFSAVFALTALPAIVLWGLLMRDPGGGIFFGFFFGLLFALAMIPFLKTERRTERGEDRAGFECKLKIEMTGLGYTPHVVDPDIVQFKGSTPTVFKYGPLQSNGEHLSRVTVHFAPGEAVFVGPSWMLKKITGRIG
jgi:hypothetical protein